MHELLQITAAIILVSLVSLIGIVFLLTKKKLGRILTFIVAFAAGTMLATAFFHLIPESFEEINTLWPVLAGIILFFIIESVIHWHHSHELHCKDCINPMAYLNIIGDGIHNLLDGIIIAASFLIDPKTGIIVTASILMHEIPQEIGDFAILLHSGISKRKALLLNLASALVAVIGGVLGYFFFTNLEFTLPYIVGIAAGGFIYIAGVDIFPTLHKEKNRIKRVIQTIALIIGILAIWLLTSMHF
jgi:zinc and cadmium transporter